MKLINEKKCTGCMACYNACNSSAIKIGYDKKGFYNPIIDAKKCVNCHKCIKACPIDKNLKKEDSKKAFVFQISDRNIRYNSTSGGAFTAIAQLIIEAGGVVFGAKFNDEWKVVHSYVEKKEELQIFRGSKYVQSNVKKSYVQVEKFLLEDKYVCFSGTSCQIAGLKRYLGKNYEKLITIDFACRGIGSPKLWDEYISTFKEHITKVQFRNKLYGYAGSTMALEMDKRLKTRGKALKFYKELFFMDINIRDSCFSCQYKGSERVSDITLFDCFHINIFDKSMDDDLGTSSILTNTDKGLRWIKKIEKGNRLLEVNLKKLIEKDGDMIAGYAGSGTEKRDMFWEDYKKLEISELRDKYSTCNMKRMLIEELKPILFKLKILNKIKRKVEK